MKSVWVNAILLSLGLAILAALAIARSERTGINASYFSTYDSGRNGYRALYRVLAREGIPVQRFERSVGLLGPRIRTLVISSNALERGAAVGLSGMSVADATRLRVFVEGGGRLVLLGADAYPALRKALHLPSGIDAARMVSRLQVFVPIVRVAANAGVVHVQARSRALFAFGAAPDAVPLLGNHAGLLAVSVRRGKGSVVAIGAPDAWSNAQLAHADNARFAYGVLAGHGKIAFDEHVHGYAIDANFWAALPRVVHIAIFIAIALVLLWLIEANFLVPPVRRREPLDERDSRAYLDAMAALLRRAGAGAVAIAHFVEDIERRNPHRYPTQASALVQLQQLRGMHRPKDVDVLRAAQLYFSLRKDLT